MIFKPGKKQEDIFAYEYISQGDQRLGLTRISIGFWRYVLESPYYKIFLNVWFYISCWSPQALFRSSGIILVINRWSNRVFFCSSYFSCLLRRSILEKLYAQKIKVIINQNPHQFWFCNKDRTVKQVHEWPNQISNDLIAKRSCSTVFLDISQAFNKA